MLNKLISFVLVFFFMQTSAVFAVEQKVVAVVNDAIITDFDLQNRLTLVIKTSNINPSKAVLNSIKWQVLQMLIDEKLFDQEAKRLKVTIDEMDLNEAKRYIAAQNNINLNQLPSFLARVGISYKEFEKQLNSQILWNRIVKTQIEPYVKVFETEVLNYRNISHIPKSLDREVKLAEIVIFTNKKNQAITNELANQLASQAKNNPEFAKLAREFSQSSSRSKGGEIGWFKLSQLSEQFVKHIANLKSGEVSEPIYSEGEIRILKILDEKNKSDVESKAAGLIQQAEQKEKIKEIIRLKKLDNQVKQYLQKLRNRAYIDVKGK